MTTITVWLLISVSAGMYNGGSVSKIAEFATEQACKDVAFEVTLMGPNKASCIKAEIIVKP